MSNEPKWTPGPWGTVVHGQRDSRVGANTLIAIVYSTAFRDQENQKANAHLIAAAPDLYRGVQAAWHALQSLRACRDGMTEEALRSTVEFLDQVMLKAQECR